MATGTDDRVRLNPYGDDCDDWLTDSLCMTLADTFAATVTNTSLDSFRQAVAECRYEDAQEIVSTWRFEDDREIARVIIALEAGLFRGELAKVSRNEFEAARNQLEWDVRQLEEQLRYLDAIVVD